MSDETKMPDRNLIWENCPACAYKHLTAAYAALTANVFTGEEGLSFVPAEEVYSARADIALREAASGYPGNRALAIGCLAMAELESAEHADAYRARRLYLVTGAQSSLLQLSPTVTECAMAGAHLYEAVRELPALAEEFGIHSYVYNGGLDLSDVRGLRELLRNAIRHVESVYELKGTP